MPATGDPRPFDVSIIDPKERLQKYIDRYRHDPGYDGFEATLMRNIRIMSAHRVNIEEGGQARCVFEVDVVNGLLNPMGNMHGGAVATLADMATTMATAPISRRGWWEFGGVSRTLNVTYLSPIRGGSVVIVDCLLRSIGKRLSTTQCTIKDKKDGRLLALAEHGKVALSDQPETTKSQL